MVYKNKGLDMKKIVFLLFLMFVGLSAQESREDLYANISLDDEHNITKATIKQYVTSSFNVSAHQANYFLPVSYRFKDDYYDVVNHNYNDPPQQLETEFQVSIKFDVASNIFGLDEIYTVAYTQKSFWQLYTASSAYFRESNYNPEFFITFPLRVSQDTSGLRGMRIGAAHQSNGQGGIYERSWNYFYSDFYAQLGFIFVDLKLWYSPYGSREKYNPDLLDYLGNGHLRFVIPYKKNILETTFMSAFNGHSSAEVHYTHPVYGRDDLFVYVKGFMGYGESLIDYQTNVSKLGIGFSISR